MGEVVLRKIQAGIETTRGTAVPATRKVYGTAAITKAWPRRFAVEDRGSFTDKFRANRKLVEAGVTLTMDATFEDTPWIMAHTLRGGITPTGASGSGYTWSFAPDINTDLLSTSTIEAGDDTVAMQGNFFTVDTADFALPLDDALVATVGAFVQDWTPQSYPAYLTTPFAGFTGSLAERTVESTLGWQQRCYIDPTGTAVGTTQVTGRFKTAAWAYHNQNKRKYFGDGGYVYTKLGRGRRQVSGTLTFEAVDTQQYADFAANNSKAIRIQLIGSAISGTSLGSTTAALNPGTISSIPVGALAANVPGGVGISVGGVSFAVTAAGAIMGATAIPVQPQVLSTTIPTTQTVMAARTMNFDFWGVLETWTYGNVDTNTTYAFAFQAMYDATAAKECAVTIVNGVSTMV